MPSHANSGLLRGIFNESDKITLPHAKRRALRKNDYISMSRIITEETFAGIIALLAQDKKVTLFQKLLMSEKTDDATDEPTNGAQTGGKSAETTETGGNK